jgi:hypothetical protein
MKELIYSAIAPFDPAIDHPITLTFDEIDESVRFPLSNTELHYESDRDCNLYNLFWSWHDRPYAKSITVRITAPIYTSQGISTAPVDDITAMVLRFFPGYQETIYGTEEGIIVSKRIFAPLGSGYDRSVLWLMECQAEGDRLLRIEIDIDWGVPLTQRIVDGLLVAQANPGQAQGLHGQQNAESTRVFGTGEGRPDWVYFPDEQSAQLIYHLLVAGQVDLPLILTVSDVGEQVAWNGFLALRDISRSFKLSQDVWTKVSRSGRLWTPYPPLNRAVQLGKEAAIQDLRRLRTGYAPADQRIVSVPPLVDNLDTFEPERSRHLLDHLRRTADRTGGRLPVELPAMPGPTPPPDPGAALIETNVAYLESLASHLSRQPDVAVLHEHYATAERCIEAVLSMGAEGLDLPDKDLVSMQTGLYLASRLAGLQARTEEETSWLNAAMKVRETLAHRRYIRARGDELGVRDWADLDLLTDLASLTTAQLLTISGKAIWQGCGISVRRGEIYVSPQWPKAWGWWAVLDLPVMGKALSLLWDGDTLYSNRPIRFDGNTLLQNQISAEGSDVDTFKLRFRLRNGNVRRSFRPIFYAEGSWYNRESVRGIWSEG